MGIALTKDSIDLGIVVTDIEASLAGEVLLFPETGTNVVCVNPISNDGDIFADCELVVEGYAINPKFLVCRLFNEEGTAYRKVSLWRSNGRNIRPPMKVTAKFDGVHGTNLNPIYNLA